MKEVQVVYTRWRNLKKTKSMEAGQIGFHDQSKVIITLDYVYLATSSLLTHAHTFYFIFEQVRKIKVDKCNSIVNALNRTKEVSQRECTLVLIYFTS